MFCEASACIVDPQNRSLDLSDILGEKVDWKIDENGNQYCRYRSISLGQSILSNEQRKKLNELGLTKDTGEKFNMVNIKDTFDYWSWGKFYFKFLLVCVVIIMIIFAICEYVFSMDIIGVSVIN